MILSNGHHRTGRRRRGGDGAQNQREVPRKREDQPHENGDKKPGEKSLRNGNDENFYTGCAKHLFFKKLSDPKSDKCQSHIADKPHPVNHLRRYRAQHTGTDQYACDNVTGDVRQAKQLRHARGQKAADQNQGKRDQDDARLGKVCI